MKVRVEQDPDPMSPRDWDNVGTMVCFHNRYTLGDGHNINHRDFISWDGIREHLEKEHGATHILPLYLYDHSGITMNTTGFSCPWDSGQVGFIYATKDSVARMGVKSGEVADCLRSEVAVYDKYLQGDVWGYVLVDDDGNHIDSCWGFFDENEAREAGEESLAHYTETQ